ncbi:uncharacterized protein [Physcomitrium patens]|uniref:Interferon-related developmental regulator N-terminal domain-containing protein n=2 Tax=Physcomitrium patens TaxID=3218 RepID=A0A2K1IUS2_PHYPA|nr:interferon-related developmental regulator 2-like [Physcomitrium patens]PNR33027.1 hypothetical protein PHYPA_024970 [Physcomitrium patens]|eukprot:XP_024358487.1 interferon-related developmental regulator 2-like [Physcomitrella patens]
MGRSRKDRKSARDEYTDDDTMSTTSTVSSSDFNNGPEVEGEFDESTLMDQYVEALYQKRASIREAGLKGLIDAFTSTDLTDFAEGQCETLSSRFINSVKVGAGNEAAQGARALGLLAFTVGDGSNAQQILADATPHLWKVARVGSSPAARSASLQALGHLAFIGAVDLEATEATMELLWSLINHRRSVEDQKTGINSPPASVKVSALMAWSLLLSTVDSQKVSSHHLQSSLPVLSSLLNSEDLALRTAAGESIALLYEMTNSSGFAGDVEDSVDDIVPPVSRPSNSSVASSARATVPEDEVIEQMKALSVHAGGKGQPKKERAALRSSFRELLAAIEDGVAPQVSVKLPAGNTLKFNSWTEIIQVNAIRRFLGEGFQTHMQGNPLLHEIFDFVPQSEKRNTLSTKEKRMLQSPNSVVSKARTEVMNRRRQNSQAQKIGDFSASGYNSD